MKQFLYIIGISVIWMVLLYFFAEVYYHPSPSASSSHTSSTQINHPLPTHSSPSKLHPREKKIIQRDVSQKSAVTSNLTKIYKETALSFTPLMPLATNTKSLDHVLKDKLHSSEAPPAKPQTYHERLGEKKPARPEDYKVPKTEGIPWADFAQHPMPPLAKGPSFPKDPNLIICPKEVEQKLQERLSSEDMDWCKWALSPTGGQVQVGKSYGTLKSRDREKYEKLNCNNVAKGENPSCDDAWGDPSILYWKKNLLPELCGDRSRYNSKVICRQSNSNAKFCVFENVLLDFAKMSNVRRPGRSDSRKWDKGFLATHCDRNEHPDIDYYEFYDAAVNPAATRCNYVINETIVMYGHDDIRNLGHSMSDFMNVWAMLWLAGLGNYAQDIAFFNTDAIRQGHNYYDDLGKFSRHYELQFRHILKAKDFTGSNKVCVKRVVFMPRPVILFTWDGWWMDMPCTFVGPSSLYQRWNLQVRQLYQLYPLPKEMQEDDRKAGVRVLLIKRTVQGNQANMYTSRVIRNLDEISSKLKESFGKEVVREWIIEDLARLSFEEQIRLVASVHLIVGVHGAGVPTSMHMSIGRPNCCGVIEIFPEGEFRPIRGYGNMARRVGHHYRRLDVTSQHSSGSGVFIPVDSLVSMVGEVLEAMKMKPSCVLESVVKDPYFDSVPIDPKVMKIE